MCVYTLHAYCRIGARHGRNAVAQFEFHETVTGKVAFLLVAELKLHLCSMYCESVKNGLVKCMCCRLQDAQVTADCCVLQQRWQTTLWHSFHLLQFGPSAVLTFCVLSCADSVCLSVLWTTGALCAWSSSVNRVVKVARTVRGCVGLTAWHWTYCSCVGPFAWHWSYCSCVGLIAWHWSNCSGVRLIA